MKKIEYELVLEKEMGDICVDTFASKLLAEEERDNRNRLCIAMGYSPDVKYIIKEKL
mgnify:FL=1|jgi:hypothetical protein|tara:strand:+ start:405 stop:575 length:171 start_codon:yes stop_codon:yes gene_type:complete